MNSLSVPQPTNDEVRSQRTLVYAPPSRALPPLNDQRNRDDPERQRALHELSQDIRRRGVLSPPGVYPEGDRFRVIYGWTRIQAAQIAGLPEIPFLVWSEPPSPSELALATYQENDKRYALTAIEAAAVYVETMRQQGWSQTQLCKELSLNPSIVSKRLKLFEKLALPLHEKIGDGPGMLPFRGGLAICNLPEDEQMEFAGRMMAGMIGVEYVEIALAKKKHQRPKPKKLRFDLKQVKVEIGEDKTAAINELRAIIAELRTAK